jgi:hypothetical protein
MVTSLLIGFSCVFFILGHSTLLFFKSKELSAMPIREAILPWPKQGKFVSVLCLVVSVASIFLMFYLPPENESSPSSSAWKILSIFVLFPSAIYANYLATRLVYCPTDPTPQEWSLPIAISVFVSVIFWIFK